MQKKVIVLIGLALFLANASFAQQVKTDYDRAANFKSIQNLQLGESPDSRSVVG